TERVDLEMGVDPVAVGGASVAGTVIEIAGGEQTEGDGGAAPTREHVVVIVFETPGIFTGCGERGFEGQTLVGGEGGVETEPAVLVPPPTDPGRILDRGR